MKRTYKKFNLGEALNGAKLETREGLKVKSIHLIENTNNPNPLVVVLENTDGDDIISCTINGRFWNDNCDSSLDLFIVEEVKIHYVNVYKQVDGRLYLSAIAYETRHAAVNCISEPKGSTYIKTIEVTDELENPCKNIEIDTNQYKKMYRINVLK